MKRLLFILALLCVQPVFAQSFSGQSAGDIFIAPPYRSCWGADNGQAFCITQTGSLLVRATGAIDAQIPAKTVSTLGSASLNNGRLYRVTDGNSATDCTTGGGSTVLLCLSNGTSWSSVGGAGGGSPPSGNNGDLQSKNGSNLSASHINDNGSVIATSEDTQLIGPNPSVDIRAYGARAVTISTTCTGSGTALTVGSSSFVNGDGISCVGGGAPPVMSTPGAPTVTPGLTASGTQSDAPIATGAAATGSTTYNYKIFAVSRSGEVTAPSSVTTITNGLSALGKNSVTLNSLSLLNNTLTYASASSTGLVASAVVHITAGSNSASLSGWFPVSTIDSSTQAHTSNTAVYSASTVSAASGTLVDFVANQVTWTAVTGAFAYGVCSDRASPGTYHVIGYSYPTSTGGGDAITTFDDFGFSVTTSPFWYLGDAQCTGSAINSLYVGTVTAGGGTTSLTVSPALTNTVSGASARFDNAPTILAAANAAKSSSAQVYVPTGTFPLNSQLNLPSGLGVEQCGNITANATIVINSSTTWIGYCRSNGGTPQFATFGPPQIQENSYPGILSVEAAGSISFENIDLFAPDQGLGTVIDGSSGTGFSFHSVDIRTGTTASDTTGVALMIRGGLYFDIADYFLSGGPDQVIDKTWTPSLYTPVAFGPGAIGQIQMEHGTWNRRGILAQYNPAGVTWKIDGVARQGGITPVFTLQQTGSGVTGGTVTALNIHGDTESQAKLAFICNVSCGGLHPTAQLQTVNGTSNDGGGTPSNVTGNGGENFATPEESGAGFHGLLYGPTSAGSLLATDNLIPFIAGSNLGVSSDPFGSLFLSGSLIFTTNAPIIWQSIEGSCTGAAATKDALCIGGSTAAGYTLPGIREAVGAGSFLRLPQETTAAESAASGLLAEFDGNGNLLPGSFSLTSNPTTGMVSCLDVTPACVSDHAVLDATVTSGSNIVTCPNSDCHFLTTAANGQVVQAGDNTHGVDITTTTILSVDSDTQIHTTANSSNSSGAAAAYLAWGPDNTASLDALSAATTTVCKYGFIPAGYYFTQHAEFNFKSSCSNVDAGAGGIIGAGPTWLNTKILMRYDFQYTSGGPSGSGCNGGVSSKACFGGVAGQDFRSFSVDMMLYQTNPASLTYITENNAAYWDRVGVSGPTGSLAPANLVLSHFAGIQPISREGASVGGSIACINDGTDLILSLHDCIDANTIGLEGNTGSFHSKANYHNSQGGTGNCGINSLPCATTCNPGATCFHEGDTFSSGQVANTGNATYEDAFTVTGAGQTFTTLSGGVSVFVDNVNINPPVTNNSGGIIKDLGGNTFSGTITNNGLWVGEANSANRVALTAGRTVLSAGWGSTAAVTAPAGGDFPIQFTITNSGTGQGASPTITYTYPSALQVAPFSCSAVQTGGTNATGTFTSNTPSTTAVTFTFSLTPTASSTEIVQVTCVTP